MNSIVFNQDCIEGMKRYPDNYFDLAVVDPPYGIGRSGHNGVIAKNPKHNWKAHTWKDWDKEMPSSEYWKQLFRVSKNQIVWGSNYFTEYLPASMGWIFWDKGQDLTMSDGELAYTSFNRALRRIKINRGQLMIEGGTIHPTQKPIKLYDWIFHNYAKPTDKILDTHLGSGSSRIAAYKNGLDFTGFELDKDYFEASEKRFNNFKSQLTLF
jgi:site-specific DNA-methyltransferase (adenine-specific)